MTNIEGDTLVVFFTGTEHIYYLFENIPYELVRGEFIRLAEPGTNPKKIIVRAVHKSTERDFPYSRKQIIEMELIEKYLEYFQDVANFD